MAVGCGFLGFDYGGGGVDVADVVAVRDAVEVEEEGVELGASGRAVLAAAGARLAGGGRLVVRPSGTEPLIRIMAEHEDAALAEEAVAALEEAICHQAG